MVADDTGADAPEGKTTSDLQTPTAYGTGNAIYANWNENLDGVTGDDNPWDFGTATQYPVLQYGSHVASEQQPATFTLAASPTSICESSKGSNANACGANPVTSTTVTATLDLAKTYDITITLPTNAAYTPNAPSIVVAAGTTTKTLTLTAVNNRKCGTRDCGVTTPADDTITLTPTADRGATLSGSAPVLTIKDDDILAKPTGLSVNGVSGSGNDTKLKAAWNTVTGADGYYVWWKSGTDDYASSRRKTVSGGSSKTTELTGLTADTEYTVRVSAYKATYDDSAPSDEAKATPGKVDYDTDNDRLIEIKTLAQLNAIRHDLDGGGSETHADYTAAYPAAATNMGCPSGCQGYELANDLDFDTGTKGDRTDDTYYNSGAGWTTIGIAGNDAQPYNAILEGNEYEIKNLYINGTSTGTDYFALFYNLNPSAIIRNVYLTNVSVTGASTGTGTGAMAYVSALTVWNQGTVTDSYVTGSVTASQTGGGGSTAYAGGFIANNIAGTIRKSYSSVTVTATVTGSGNAMAGGLVAWNNIGTIEASYATSDVTITGSTNSGNDADAGGLVGNNNYGTITAAYSTGNVSASAGGTVDVGGLVGNHFGGTITAAWSKGVPTGDDSGTNNVGGLIGTGAGTVNNSYWDTDVSGIADDADNNAPEGKTTSELQTPTEAQKSLPNYPSGLYANWNVNVDGVTGDDNPWDFGTATQYPVLHVRTLPYVLLQSVPTVTWAVANATLCESSKGTDTAACGASPVTSTTITPTLSGEWKTDLTYTFPADAAKYTLSKSSLTIPAGSTTVAGITLTAVNNKVDAADATVSLSPTSSHLRQTFTVPTITIKDDDSLTAPTITVVSGASHTSLVVSWPAVTNATGYGLEYKLSTDSPWKTETVTDTTAPFSHTITGLTKGNLYDIRVYATKTGVDDGPYATASASPGVDYDSDGDGLLEITTLAQLNAVRYDLDGDGSPSSGNETAYNAAFGNAASGLGCPSTGCTGYELSANLDFNTNNSAKSSTNPAGADSGDTYWNSGNGWDPIGGVSGGHYTGDFDGSGYTISNLFIDRSSGDYAGLFAYLNGGSGTKVQNVSLVNLDVTLNTSTGRSIHVGGLAGRVGNGGVEIEDSYTTGRVRGGESATEPVTLTNSPGYSYVGGLVGRARADITGSYSLADVTSNTKSASTGPNALVGGLVGEVRSSGSVNASYAAGTVTANIVGQNNNFVYAGGLVGQLHGDINASYARGAVTAASDATVTNGITGNAGAGGLVGATPSGSGITASFSTGAPTATGDGQIVRARGLVGVVFSTATVTNSYWDTETSGITDTGAGTSKTTSQLQTPTAYGTGANDIYKDWDIDLDTATAGLQDAWDFGTNKQYPALKYGALTAADQRATVTLSVSPATIWERAATTPSRVNSATVTATLDKTWNAPVVVTLPTNAAYAMSPTKITIAAGATTGTATLTAVNNYTDAANAVITLTLAGNPADTKWVSKGTDVSVTINDDDELTKPTGVKLSVDGTKIRVDWTRVTGATGYKVQWTTANTDSGWASPTGTATKSDGATVTHTISSGLSANTTYYVRVLPTKSGADEPPSDVASATTTASAGSGDYDADNDGLIEIDSLAKLNAVRWDLDGDGAGDKHDSNNDGDYDDAGEYDYTSNYAAVFTGAEDNMGCNESVATITSGTGNPACAGYELSANLDFDTNSSGGPNAGDTYWNSGQGWQPIGGAFDATFEGNTYTISNLHINRSGATTVQYAGLFAQLGSAAKISNLKLKDVSVTVATNAAASADPGAVYAGGIAGENAGDIIASYVTGTVQAVQSALTNATPTEGDAYAGGLAGNNTGDIAASFARGTVTAEQKSTTASLSTYAGGLAGYHNTGSVKASYADVDAEAKTTASATSATLTAGGLLGHAAGGSVTASYSVGAPTTTGGTSPTASAGGLIGANSATVTKGYWDTTQSGITATGAGTGKTTSELKTPTTETGIYANWDIDVDGKTGNDDPWDFGTASQYPILKHGNLSGVTQRATVTYGFNPATIYEKVGGATSTTVTATLAPAWSDSVTVTPNADAATYTLSADTITIAAGSTSGTVTLTAVNNYKCGTSDCPSDKSNKLVSLTGSTNDPWVDVATSPTLTITDDDLLGKPTGVKLSVDGAKIQVDWTAVPNADGYIVQWSESSTFAGAPSSATKSGGSTTTHKITTGLTSGTTYYFRVIATKTGEDNSVPSDTVSATPTTGSVDYDADNDGLIEVSSLAQLNAIRWDLNGNGAVDDSTNATAYTTAFPNAESNMGCGESVASISSGTGNAACSGYELSADLDFDTGTAGTRSDDTYYNGGQGWQPIGGAFDATFEGNAYTISNLHINRSGANTVQYGGLFRRLDSSAKISNLKLKDVSVTVTTNAAAPDAPGAVYAGGVAGENTGDIIASYVTGTVKAVQSALTNNSLTEGDAYAGGLAGKSTGDIAASFARGIVTAEQKSTTTGLSTYAGGLAGYHNTGSVKASYANVDAEAKTTATATSATLTAGGLVGNIQSGSITASYATGAPKTTGGATPTVRKGGLAGYKHSTGVTDTNNYWDTATSGVTDTGAGTGKTTSGLQTPTAYGTGANDIYKDWNLNLDGVTGNDDPWNFGTSSQYPVLKYDNLSGVTQWPTATLTVSPTSIYEGTGGGSTRTIAATVTATLSEKWHKSVTVTPAAAAATYTLSPATIAIAVGSTTGTTTLTAVNNYKCGTSDCPSAKVHKSVSLTATADPWLTFAAAPTLTITDDDELGKPTMTVTEGSDHDSLNISWPNVDGATGYKLEWRIHNAANPNDWTVVSSPTSPQIITSLNHNDLYDIRLAATKTGADQSAWDEVTTSPGEDYDADDDGLIEVKTPAQLNAMRWDLGGDGAVDNAANATAYNTAFPARHHGMGCNEDLPNVSQRTCTGYELAASVDLDTNDNGVADSNDAYWNGGAGWEPIGGQLGGNAYAALFDGNAYAETGVGADGGPYTISNLFIDRTGATYGGLFAKLAGGAEVYDVGLTDVDITVRPTTGYDVYVGALAGINNSDVENSYSIGSVSADVTFNVDDRSLYVGGLIGRSESDILASYSWAVVSAKVGADTNITGANAYAGGLVGVVDANYDVNASYAAGAVTAEVSGSGSDAYAGGLAGLLQTNAEVLASYARGAASAEVKSGTGTTTANAGGLAGKAESGSNVEYSFSTGAASATGGSLNEPGGLIGGGAVGGSATGSYWNTETSGNSTSDGGTGKTTSQLQTPIAYGTGANDIYKDWNVDVDGVTGDDDPWDFGANNQYPALKHGVHDEAAQRPTVSVAASPTTIYESVGGVTSSTVTATMSAAWNVPVTVDLNPPDCLAPATSTTEMALTFTSTTYGTAQTASVKLSDAPDATVTVALVQDNVQFTPSSLTFSTTTWNTVQTVSVRLAAAPTNDVTVYLDAFCVRHRFSAPDATIPAGSETQTVTLSATNDKVNDQNLAVLLSLDDHITDDKWVSKKSTDNTETINIVDDDELGKTTGMTAVEESGNIKVSWTAVTGATGYVIEWKSGSEDYASTRRVVVSGGSSTTGNIPEGRLTSDTTYTIRVYATKSGVDDGEPSDEATVAYKGGAGGDFNKPVLPMSQKTRTLIWGNDGNSPFPGTDHKTLGMARIVTLPAADQGELKLVQRGRFMGKPQCRNNPNFVHCRETETSVTAGQEVANPFRASVSSVKSLYFYPRAAFSNAPFDYKTIVWTNLSDPTTKGAPSATSTATLVEEPVVTPTTPTGVTASQTGVGQVTLRWTPLATDTDKIGGNRYARLQVAVKKGNGAWGNWEWVYNSDMNSSSYGYGGLEQGALYTFKLRSHNFLFTSGESAAATAQMTPAAPAGFGVTGRSGRVDLAWSPSTDATISKYQYRRSEYTPPLTGYPGDKRVELRWDAPDTGGRPVAKWQYRAHKKEATDLLGVIPGDSSATLWWTDPTVPQGKTVASWQYRFKINPAAQWTVKDIPGGAKIRRHATGYDDDYQPELWNGAQWAIQLRPRYTDETNGSWSNTALVTNSPRSFNWDWADIPRSDHFTRSYSFTSRKTGVDGSGKDIMESLANGKMYFIEVQAVTAPTGNPASAFPFPAIVVTPTATVSDGWTDLATLAATSQSKTFTSLNWNTKQAITVALSAAPEADVTVGLHQEGVIFTPNRLNFTTEDYSTAQNVQVELASQPASDVTVNVTAVNPIVASYSVTGLKDKTVQTVQTRAWNASGAGPSSAWRSSTVLPIQAPTLAVTAGDGQATLRWSADDDPTIVKWQYSKDDGANWTDVPVNGTFKWLITHDANHSSWQYKQKQPQPHAAGGLTALGNAGPVQLFWNMPDNEVDGWQYRFRKGSVSSWTNEPWRPALNSVGTTRSYSASVLPESPVYRLLQSAPLTFTPLDYNTAQTAAISLHSQPSADVKVHLKQENVEFSPAKLTFTTQNWSTVQNVQVKLKKAPTQNATVQVSLAHQVGVSFAWQARPVNSSGAVLASPIDGTATSGDSGDLALLWTFTNAKTIAKWQYRHKSGGGDYPNDWTDVPGGRNVIRYTVPSLTNGTAYTFQVQAVNSSGTRVSDLLGEATAKPSAPVAWVDMPGSGSTTRSHDIFNALHHAKSYAYTVRPGASVVPATALTVSKSGTTATVGWSGYDHIAGATGWQARKRTVGGAWGAWETVSGAASARSHAFAGLQAGVNYNFQARRVNPHYLAEVPAGTAIKSQPTSYTVTGLSNKTAYVFKVRAVNGAGAGPASTAATVTPATSLASPVLTATGLGTSVRLDWTIAQNDTITGWEYRQAEPVGGLNAFPGDISVDLVWDAPSSTTGIAKWQYRHKSGGGDYPATWTDVSGSGPTTTSATVPTLTNDTAYTFQARAVNSSDELVGTVLGDAAATPSDTAGWTAISGAATRTHTATSLTASTRYGFQARAVNSVGSGNVSNVAASYAAARPAKPTGLAATSGEDKKSTLSWPTTNTASKWQYSKDDGATWTTVTPSNGGTNHTYEATGLTNGAAYAFRVRGLNQYDEPGPASDSATATPRIAAPTGLAVTAGNTSLTVTWADPNDSTIVRYEYRLTMKDRTDTSVIPWSAMPGSSSTTTSHTITNLANGAEFDYYLRAASAGSVSLPVKVAGAPLAKPNPPAGLSVAVNDRQATLSWTDPKDASIVKWQRRTDGGSWTDIETALSASLSTLTFTTLDHATAQTSSVELPAAPPSTVKVTLAQDNVEFTPSTLTFTTDNWNMAQSVSVKLKAAPQANVTVSLARGYHANATSVTVTGLTNLKRYKFSVRAVNSSGAGVHREVFATPTALPAKPAGFSARAGNTEVFLNWLPLDGTLLAGYEYQKRTKTGLNWNEWGADWSDAGRFRRFTVTGLTNYAEYQFRVRGFNAAGPGTPSDPASATPQAPSPTKPTGLAATPGTRKVSLAWTNPAGTTGNSYRYKPKSGDDTGYTDWTSISVATSQEVTNLTNGVHYTFQARAHNRTGGGASAQVSAWTYPAAPVNLTATPGNGIVSLTWDDPANDSITRYEFQQKTGGSWNDTWTPIPSSGASTTQHVASGSLVNGTAYTFRVRAYSAGAGDVSAEVTATPQASPDIPTGLSATATGIASATVNWSYTNTALIDKFQARYRAGNGAWGDWADVAKTTMTYEVTSDLTHGTVYTFEIQAVNNQSVAGPAGQARAATAPAKPAGLAAAPSLQQATLNWDNPAYPSITAWQYRQAKPKGGLVAFGGDGEADLFWTAPADTTGIAKWQYRHKSGGGDYPNDWTDVASSSAATTSATVDSLTNATAYTFQVRAVNSSDALVGTVLGDAVATPTTTADGWTAISGSGASTTSHTVTGLDSNTAYAFQLRAVNPAGNGLASAPLTTTTAQEPAPGRPTGLTAASGDEKVTLSWTNPGGTVTGNSYRYKPKSNSDSGYTGLDRHRQRRHVQRSDRADQRRQLRLPGAGGQPDGHRPGGPGVGVDVSRRAGQPGGDARQRDGHPDLGRPIQQQRHALRVPAEDRRQLGRHLDDHTRQRPVHHAARGKQQSDQRNGLHLPAAGGERGGQRGCFGGGDGHAAAHPGGARQRQRQRNGRSERRRRPGLTRIRR